MANRFKYICLICLLSLGSVFAHADQKRDLNSVTANLKKSEHEKNTLDKKVQEISTRLIALKQDEKKLRMDLEFHEIKSSLLEKDLWLLEKQNTNIQAQLKQDFPKFNKLLSVLVHKEKTPPQVILAEAKTPESIFLSSITINALVPKIQDQILDFKKQLRMIEANKITLENSKKQLENAHKMLALKYTALQNNVSEKENLHQSSIDQRKKVATQISNLSKKAQNLEGLIKAMQQEKLMQQRKQSLFSSSKLSHKFIYPLSQSEIIEKFGTKTPLGIESKGLRLTSAASNRVISPYDGTVLFSGPFRQYGNIAIIEHEKGYHSFIAGLDRLTVKVGDILIQGEEIGELSTNGKKDSVLYFEIRNNNQPLDPSLVI